MLDRYAIAVLAPPLRSIARLLARAGVGADAVSWAGFGIGLAAAAAITQQHYALGLALLVASRVADGLDGAVARLSVPTDRGAFLDIALDFIFYASIPLAFALADPAANALPAAVLLASFVGTALRPYLTALADEAALCTAFEDALGDALSRAFPMRPDGVTLLPFPRLFLVARRR